MQFCHAAIAPQRLELVRFEVSFRKFNGYISNQFGRSLILFESIIVNQLQVRSLLFSPAPVFCLH